MPHHDSNSCCKKRDGFLLKAPPFSSGKHAEEEGKVASYLMLEFQSGETIRHATSTFPFSSLRLCRHMTSTDTTNFLDFTGAYAVSAYMLTACAGVRPGSTCSTARRRCGACRRSVQAGPAGDARSHTCNESTFPSRNREALSSKQTAFGPVPCTLKTSERTSFPFEPRVERSVVRRESGIVGIDSTRLESSGAESRLTRP